MVELPFLEREIETGQSADQAVPPALSDSNSRKPIKVPRNKSIVQLCKMEAAITGLPAHSLPPRGRVFAFVNLQPQSRRTI
jgi:hypothetical protein